MRGGKNVAPMPGKEIPPRLYWVTTASSPLNVRLGPDVGQRVMGTLPPGTLVTATRQTVGWLYITDGSGLTGWASKQFLRLDSFPFAADVQLGSWYFCSVRMAFENDIMRGTSATTFDPGHGGNYPLAHGGAWPNG